MPLYKLEKDFINDAWERSFSMSILLDPSTIQYENSDDNESINDEPITKTLLHGFTNSYRIFLF